MWELTYPWWEIVLRAAVIYVAIILLFRLIGKKQLGKMSPFDFVLILIVSESVSNGLGGEENSLLGAIISSATLLGLSYLIDFTAFKLPKFEKILEGEPQFIIVNGKVQENIRIKELITHEELKTALRKENIEDPNDVQFAVLETNGLITVIKKNNLKN